MKINKIKVNSYGRIKNKEIDFKDGINIIYGDNEKGKSTLLNFIVNMLYGTSKNKKGKAISDYDKFKPWDTEEFSGKMSYTLDDKSSFEVYREFVKKSPKIYNQNLDDITKEFSIDKTNGSQFFQEQTSVDESTFINTVVAFQNEVELDNQTQNVLLQKIANVSSTGDDNISYKKAIEKLNKKQLDEIGTNRTQEKPINVVMKEIAMLNDENMALKQYENYKYDIEEKKYNIQSEIDNLKVKDALLREINKINQEEIIEKEKLKYNENKIDELENKIQDLLSEKERINESEKNVTKYIEEKVNIIPYILLGSVCVIISILIITFTNFKLLAILPAVITFLILGIMISKISKTRKINKNKQAEYEKVMKSNNEVLKRAYEIDAQINVLELNQKEQINEAENIKNEIIKNINVKKEEIKAKYSGKISYLELNNYSSSVNINQLLNDVQQKLNEKNIELHRMDLDKENVLPKLEKLAENEERLNVCNEEFEQLKQKNNAINLAKELLECAYFKMKNDVTPKFTRSLSENISKITNGKYNKIMINEEDGLIVELQNGEYKNADLLSKGTIQAIYLAFRLSMIEDISSENMPIILDETFAYYDDNRLLETIRNLYENYSGNHQIILLTCTNREMDILEKLGIGYNKVEL